MGRATASSETTGSTRRTAQLKATGAPRLGRARGIDPRHLGRPSRPGCQQPRGAHCLEGFMAVFDRRWVALTGVRVRATDGHPHPRYSEEGCLSQRVVRTLIFKVGNVVTIKSQAKGVCSDESNTPKPAWVALSCLRYEAGRCQECPRRPVGLGRNCTT